MSMLVKIRKEREALYVHSPFNSEFIDLARSFGGQWNRFAWKFHLDEEQRVREACRYVYGADGSRFDRCTIRVDCSSSPAVVPNFLNLELFGRPLARVKKDAKGYNVAGRMQLCEGVWLLSGGFLSTATKKGWVLNNEPGTVVRIRHAPRARVQETIDSGATWLSIEAANG